ncbi:MAG: sensor histidine kinase [Duncaniella sp.]|nr:sensor histidine kinase [Duncaniella sp.]
MAMGSRSRLTYPARLFLWLLGYSLLMVGCFVVFQYHREKEFKAAEMDSRLQLINMYILTELGEGKDVSEIDLSHASPFEDLRVSVITDRGDVIYDNTLDSIHRTNHQDRVEIRQAMSSMTGYAVRRHSESTGDYYFYSARRGAGGIVVRTAVPYSLSLSSLLEADYGFLRVMGAITLIMCVLGYFATRRVGQHILRLSRFAQSVERGVRISDTEPFPHDELGEISNHIVRLYARLQQANADRDSEHRAALREQREKERIKKDLTNNISHELKTPVASIQVCVETMLEHAGMEPERREMFLRRCLANTARLNSLLEDIALITRMEDGGEAIAREPVDLAAIIREAVAERAPVAEARGLVIETDVAGPLMMAGNARLLESVLNNLIDNAVAYSGGTRIRIAGRSDSRGRILLTVSDNGTGVAEEHLGRIFERFYRVDKGRSRAAGGTGLGLSIVKNAVLFHGGSISARNGAAGGLELEIRFPA